MNKPTLVIMAAGMGSRYGGLKQIDPVDNEGHIIIDFSIYDAVLAGFEKVIFIIKEEIEAEFKRIIGNRIAKKIEVAYAYQKLDDLPEGYEVPADRQKPWGTGHAVLSCRGIIDGPFAVINADDYYGSHAFRSIYQFLSAPPEQERRQYAMAGYRLDNTLTEHGHVARGVCNIEGDDMLVDIHERTHIEKQKSKIVYTEDDGKTWITLPKDAVVSMNLWGFDTQFLEKLEKRFGYFLDAELKSNPLTCEYFLPSVVNELLQNGEAAVKVLYSPDRWYGVTYKKDKQHVIDAVAAMKKSGLYPEKF